MPRIQYNSKPAVQPQPGITNTTSDLSPPESVSSSSLKFSHLLSGLLRLPLRPHSFQPLQLIQNAAARLVLSLPRPSHVIPLIQSLRWPPVLNTKSCCWRTRLRRDLHMHTTRPLSRSTHTSPLGFSATVGHSACRFDSLPVWLWEPSPLPPPFLLKYPCLFHNYLLSFWALGRILQILLLHSN